jgi:hypothetical protein
MRLGARAPGHVLSLYLLSLSKRADPLAAQAQKNKDGLVEALYIFDIEMPDAVSEFVFWYCGDLINYESNR